MNRNLYLLGNSRESGPSSSINNITTTNGGNTITTNIDPSSSHTLFYTVPFTSDTNKIDTTTTTTATATGDLKPFDFNMYFGNTGM